MFDQGAKEGGGALRLIRRGDTYLISIGFNVDCPLVSVSIFFSFLTKVSWDVSVDNWLDKIDTLC